jgi:DNA-binding CsgD family transcriptional regulator
MSDLSFLKSWIRARPQPAGGAPAMVREFEQFFTYLFDGSPDGISILDLDYTILGVNTAMEQWYAHAGPLVGRRCYEVFHGRRAPCGSCPSRIAVETGKPNSGIVPYDAPRHARGTQDLSVFPLFDDEGRVFCLIEYVRDITDLNEEERIIGRLKQRIRFQNQTLQEQETALEVLMRRSDQAARRVAGDLQANLSASVAPLINRLKEKAAGSPLRADIELLETRLAKITSPLINRLAVEARHLTQRESEIAALVLEGRTSKEIADHFGLTVKAVDFHRMNLRKKLNLEGSTQSLQSRLSELSEP